MDSGKGTFVEPDEEMIAELKKMEVMPDGIFREGEILEIRGSLFRVNGIRPNGRMILKLQKKKGD